MTLREEGFHPERNWPLREKGVTYQVDLAVPLGHNQCLPIIIMTSAEFTPVPANALCFPPDCDIAECSQVIRQKVQSSL